jgi:hypothetical protein
MVCQACRRGTGRCSSLHPLELRMKWLPACKGSHRSVKKKRRQAPEIAVQWLRLRRRAGTRLRALFAGELPWGVVGGASQLPLVTAVENAAHRTAASHCLRRTRRSALNLLCCAERAGGRGLELALLDQKTAASEQAPIFPGPLARVPSKSNPQRPCALFTA